MEAILTHWATVLTIAATIIAATFKFWQWFFERQDAIRQREFKQYHKLVENLVDSKTDIPKIDRQTAIIFELIHYKRYYSHTKRMCLHLMDSWKGSERHCEELCKTYSYITKKWYVRWYERSYEELKQFKSWIKSLHSQSKT